MHVASYVDGARDAARVKCVPNPAHRVAAIKSAPGRSGSITVDGQLQEMRRARDAGIIVADRLLADVAQRVVVQVERPARHPRKIRLDLGLVLRGRGMMVDDRIFASSSMA